jgi:hypothetical protein
VKKRIGERFLQRDTHPDSPHPIEQAQAIQFFLDELHQRGPARFHLDSHEETAGSIVVMAGWFGGKLSVARRLFGLSVQTGDADWEILPGERRTRTWPSRSHG